MFIWKLKCLQKVSWSRSLNQHLLRFSVILHLYFPIADPIITHLALRNSTSAFSKYFSGTKPVLLGLDALLRYIKFSLTTVHGFPRYHDPGGPVPCLVSYQQWDFLPSLSHRVRQLLTSFLSFPSYSKLAFCGSRLNLKLFLKYLLSPILTLGANYILSVPVRKCFNLSHTTILETVEQFDVYDKRLGNLNYRSDFFSLAENSAWS